MKNKCSHPSKASVKSVYNCQVCEHFSWRRLKLFWRKKLPSPPPFVVDNLASWSRIWMQLGGNESWRFPKLFLWVLCAESWHIFGTCKKDPPSEGRGEGLFSCTYRIKSTWNNQWNTFKQSFNSTPGHNQDKKFWTLDTNSILQAFTLFYTVFYKAL